MNFYDILVILGVFFLFEKTVKFLKMVYLIGKESKPVQTGSVYIASDLASDDTQNYIACDEKGRIIN